MSARDLINRTNEIRRLLDSGTDEGLVQAARLACLALTELPDDADFGAALRSLDEGLGRNKDRQAYVAAAARDLEALRDFLSIEREVLTRAGVDEVFVRQVLEDIRRSWDGISKLDPSKLNARSILDRAAAARLRACETADGLRAQDEINKSRTRFRKRLRRVLFFIGGVIVFVVNRREVIFVVTNGLDVPEPILDISQAAGDALMSKEIDQD